MNGPVVIDAQGNQLLRFSRLAEEELTHLDPTIPLPLSLVVAVSESGTLMVFNRWRQEWELPGGMIDPGESPREAAAREYVEETGQAAPVLEFAGVATFALMPDHRVEYAAVFLARVTPNLTPFEANDEVEQICSWDGSTLSGLAELDAEICRLVRQPPIP